jgi:F420-non-reducing hydrogenase large subunit
MTRTIHIDPITRLEGHGRIDILLDNKGEVDQCMFVVPELRGFEKFLEGRPVEELPRLSSRICGVCPEAHLAASVKAVEAVYGVKPPPAAQLIRRLQYNAFAAADHATHFYALGGPDLILGPETPTAQRNLIGVIAAVGKDVAGKVIEMRKHGHEVAEMLGGRRINPVGMIPGGMSKPVTPAMQTRLIEIGQAMVAFCKFTISLFHDAVLSKSEFVELLRAAPFRHDAYSMALVNDRDEPDLYDGEVRVVDPRGKQFARFKPADYLAHIAEHVEPWTYLKFPFLKKVGWKGLAEAPRSGVYRVAPLAMINGSKRMQTPLAQAERDRMARWFGRGPIHSTLAYHWARIIEMTQCAELSLRAARSKRLIDPHVHTPPSGKPTEGVGIVEAPRGILLHHYVTDEKGLVRKVNIIAGTTHNHASISLSITNAARGLIHKGVALREPLLNRIEMAFRAYDPCFGCATHAWGRSGLPAYLRVLDSERRVIDVMETSHQPGGSEHG